MIEGWLDVSYAADYPARFSPSASNICGNSIDTNTKRCDFTCAYRTRSRQESPIVTTVPLEDERGEQSRHPLMPSSSEQGE